MDLLRRKTVAQYRLKENVPDIEIVDGPFAGRTFKAGTVYSEIPSTEAARFDTLGEPFAGSGDDRGGEE